MTNTNVNEFKSLSSLTLYYSLGLAPHITVYRPYEALCMEYLFSFVPSFEWYLDIHNLYIKFSVPQIEYPLGNSSKTGSHVNFLLIVAMVLLL